MLRWCTVLACIMFLVFASLGKAEIASPARQRQVLNTGWLVKQLHGESHDIATLTEAAQRPDKTWLRTDMPNQVADVLLHFGRIPDPHIGKNAAECAWIWKQDWTYAKIFDSPSGEGPVWLRLMGVDTIAVVYVNGQEVGRCNNMFRRYAFDIRSVLKNSGDNVLLVVFTGPAKELARIEREVNLKHGIAATKYMRKSQCDFNNYLGARPNFMKVGIFREVVLDVPATTWLEDTMIRPTLSDDLKQADVQVMLDARGPTLE